MKIGPFLISRVRRNKAGLKVYPWQALTEDRVTPELRQIIAKMARSEVKNLLAALRETNGDFNCPNQAIICPEDHLCSVCPRAKESA